MRKMRKIILSVIVLLIQTACASVPADDVLVITFAGLMKI